MASLNECKFIGNLGRDVEVRYTSDGKAVASLAIACGESWKDKNSGEKVEHTEWVNVSAFGKLAEIMGEYLKKGSKVYISGKMKTDKYEKEGVTKYSTKIIAKDMIMLDSRSNTEEGQSAPAGQSQEQPSKPAPPVDDNFDDDIPF